MVAEVLSGVHYLMNITLHWDFLQEFKIQLLKDSQGI